MRKLVGYDDFVCIADRCPDDCCHGWSISVDDATWAKYNGSPAFRKAGFLERIELTDIDGKPLRRFVLDDANNCAFLENGLCSLYLKLGETFQTEVCRRHPRAVHRFCGETEYVLKPDCPAVAEALLLKTEPLVLMSYPDDGFVPPLSHRGFPGLRDDVTRTVRDFTVSLLQARETPLYDRLFVLGSFCAWAQDRQQGGDLIQKQCGSVRATLSERTHEAFRFPHGAQTLDLRRQLPKAFIPVLRAVVSRPNIFPRDWDDSILTVELSAEALEDVYTHVLYPYYQTHEHVFENFLVSQIYANAFPFPYQSLTDACHNLMLQYALFQLWLVMLCCNSEHVRDSDFVRAAYYFCKCVNHDANCVQYLSENARLLNLGQYLNWLSFCS